MYRVEGPSGHRRSENCETGAGEGITVRVD